MLNFIWTDLYWSLDDALFHSHTDGVMVSMLHVNGFFAGVLQAPLCHRSARLNADWLYRFWDTNNRNLTGNSMVLGYFPPCRLVAARQKVEDEFTRLYNEIDDWGCYMNETEHHLRQQWHIDAFLEWVRLGPLNQHLLPERRHPNNWAGGESWVRVSTRKTVDFEACEDTGGQLYFDEWLNTQDERWVSLVQEKGYKTLYEAFLADYRAALQLDAFIEWVQGGQVQHERHSIYWHHKSETLVFFYAAGDGSVLDELGQQDTSRLAAKLLGEYKPLYDRFKALHSHLHFGWTTDTSAVPSVSSEPCDDCLGAGCGVCEPCDFSDDFELDEHDPEQM